MPMLVITFLRVFLISVVLTIIFVYWLNKPIEWIWISMVTSIVCSAIVASVWLQWGLRRVEKRISQMTPSPA